MARTVSAWFEAVTDFADREVHGLEFFQFVRLLIEALRRDGANSGDSSGARSDWDSLFREHLRIRPQLSMAFPESDIANLRKLTDGRLLIETNFFGLYGVTSPLPHFYTEDLLEAEQNGYRSARGLIDIFHYSAYSLLIKAWSRHRIATGLQTAQNSRQIGRETSWIGLIDPAARARFDQWRRMLPLAPFLANAYHSASGLQAMVSQISGSGQVQVKPCKETRVTIPVEHRLHLGQQNHQLGVDTVLGLTLQDRNGHIEVCLENQEPTDLKALIPSGSRYRLLEQSIQLYLKSPLRICMRFIAEPQASQLGSSRLGLGAGLGGQSRLDSFAYYLTN